MDYFPLLLEQLKKKKKTKTKQNQQLPPLGPALQVVAKLKHSTLEMLGEGAEAAQKMTRLINPQARHARRGARWAAWWTTQGRGQMEDVWVTNGG